MKEINLTDRQQKIIKYFLDNENWSTSAHISKAIGVSDKTIRNDILRINRTIKECGVSIVSKRSKGYKIDKPDCLRSFIDKKIIIICEQSEDVFFEILKELLNTGDEINIDDLCDEYYLSRSAIEEKIKRIKNVLRVFNGDVSLYRKNNSIKIIGEEKNIRELMNFIIISSGHTNSSLDLQNYGKFFKLCDLKLVQKVVLEELKNSNISMSDTGIVAIALHVLINVERIRYGYILKKSFVKELNNQTEYKKTAERESSRRITERLEDVLGVKFNDYEIDAIAYYISFRRFFASEEVCCDLDLKNGILQVLKDIDNQFLIDLTNDEELINGLFYHFKILKQRFDLKINYQNPILEDFKDKYPFMFEIAIYARERFAKLLHIDLNEDEVGFIAIHIGAAFERFKGTGADDKLCVVLVSHLNYPSSQLLITKLRSSFSDSCIIYGPFSVFDLSEICDVDPKLIITTSQLKKLDWNCEILKINSVLTKKDIAIISGKIKKIVDAKNRFDYERIFKKELFFKDPDIIEKNELIHFLSEKLRELNYVDEEYEQSVLEREKFSSTTMQNGIALPHSTGDHSKRTAIAVALLKRPINWSGRKVKVVFMMSVANKDKHNLELFYEFIVDLSDEENYVNQILKVKNYESFIELIKKNQ